MPPAWWLRKHLETLRAEKSIVPKKIEQQTKDGRK